MSDLRLLGAAVSGAAIVAILPPFSFGEEKGDPDTTAVETAESVATGSPGPWGEIEFYEIALDCPESFVGEFKVPSQQVEWRIPSVSQANLGQFFTEAGFAPEETEFLLDGAGILTDEGTLRLFPRAEVVAGMPATTRSRLYRLLATFEENPYHRRPVYINSQNLSKWFQGTELPRSVIQDIAALAYPTPRGHGFFYCDFPFTLRLVGSATGERQVLRGLLRQRGLIARLRLTPGSPIREISSYWTAGYKNKAVLPILESVVKAYESGTIDIAHLLPATPRQYLNRYPELSDGFSGRYPDWFWTCYNFFRFHPLEIHADSPERAELMIRDFHPTLPPHQFGDMILLNSGTRIVHGCIYIADDIVFTKNGSDIFSPWLLMKLEDVVAYHDVFGDISLSTYRRNESDGPLP